MFSVKPPLKQQRRSTLIRLLAVLLAFVAFLWSLTQNVRVEFRTFVGNVPVSSGRFELTRIMSRKHHSKAIPLRVGADGVYRAEIKPSPNFEIRGGLGLGAWRCQRVDAPGEGNTQYVTLRGSAWPFATVSARVDFHCEDFGLFKLFASDSETMQVVFPIANDPPPLGAKQAVVVDGKRGGLSSLHWRLPDRHRAREPSAVAFVVRIEHVDGPKFEYSGGHERPREDLSVLLQDRTGAPLTSRVFEGRMPGWIVVRPGPGAPSADIEGVDETAVLEWIESSLLAALPAP